MEKNTKEKRKRREESSTLLEQSPLRRPLKAFTPMAPAPALTLICHPKTALGRKPPEGPR
jgi:hypothetical protein